MSLLSIFHLIHRHLLWFLISAYVLAMIFPLPGLWIRSMSFGEVNLFQQKTHVSLLMVMLAILMFNAGLGLIIFYNLVQHIVAGTVYEVVSKRQGNPDT